MVLEEIRDGCAWVAARARHVRLDEAAIEPYAAGLAIPTEPEPYPLHDPDADAEERAALVLTLDAVNFGSGWFPTLRKRAHLSGSGSIAAALRERFARAGPWTAAELAALDVPAVAGALDQEDGHPLMALYARALNELGRRVTEEHAGHYTGVVETAGGSAPRLVARLASWPMWADASWYAGRQVPFLKRAQIAAADLARAGVGAWHDLDRLTLFADNLVPHVLRLDGVLRFTPHLAARIERGERLAHGSPEEVEIRAVAVEAVERLSAARPELPPWRIDHALWHRGQGARYKAVPRHRARCTAY